MKEMTTVINKNDGIKRINPAEFRQIGLLQEINRLFLHPRGLGLEIIVGINDGIETFGGVHDYREDPEGMAFIVTPNNEAAARVQKMYDDKLEARQVLFGTEDGIQPTAPWPETELCPCGRAVGHGRQEE